MAKDSEPVTRDCADEASTLPSRTPWSTSMALGFVFALVVGVVVLAFV